MRPISELLNFNLRNIFIGDLSNEICEKTATRKCLHGTTISEFQEKFEKRAKSLQLATEIYRQKVF